MSGVAEGSGCEVAVSAARRIHKVVFKLDGGTIGTEYGAPYNCSIDAAQLFSAGSHTIVATAYSSGDKRTSASTTIRVAAARRRARPRPQRLNRLRPPEPTPAPAPNPTPTPEPTPTPAPSATGLVIGIDGGSDPGWNSKKSSCAPPRRRGHPP